MISKRMAMVAVLGLAGIVVGQEKAVFEMRALATPDYDKGGVKFDLSAEQQRLRAWLSVAGNRKKLESEPLFIHLFNQLESGDGGPLSPELAWFPHKVLPSSRNRGQWEYSYAMWPTGNGTVPVFGEAEWNDGIRPAGAPDFLLELMPVNLHDTCFTERDMDPGTIRAALDAAELPAVIYGIRPDRQDASAEWSGRMIEKAAALIINGQVLSAPVFRGYILLSAE